MSKFLRTVVTQNVDWSFQSYENQKGEQVSIPAPFNTAGRSVLRAYILVNEYTADNSLETVHLTVVRNE